LFICKIYFSNIKLDPKISGRLDGEFVAPMHKF